MTTRKFGESGEPTMRARTGWLATQRPEPEVPPRVIDAGPRIEDPSFALKELPDNASFARGGAETLAHFAEGLRDEPTRPIAIAPPLPLRHRPLPRPVPEPAPRPAPQPVPAPRQGPTPQPAPAPPFGLPPTAGGPPAWIGSPTDPGPSTPSDEQFLANTFGSGIKNLNLTTTQESQLAGLTRDVGNHDPKLFWALYSMVATGLLTSKDSSGTTVLDNLSALASHLGAKGVTHGLLYDLMHTMEDPASIYQGDNTRTCAATTVEELLATFSPGDFATFATTLLLNGAGKTPTGKTVPLAGDASSPHRHGRDSLDTIIQTSMMSYALTLAPGTGSSVSGGRYGSSGAMGGGRYGVSGAWGGGRYGSSGAMGGGRYGSSGTMGGVSSDASGQGLTGAQLAALVGVFLPNRADYLSATDANASSVVDRVIAALAPGVGVPVGVRVPVLDQNGKPEQDANGNPIYAGHAILIEGYDAKTQMFTFYDPGDPEHPQKHVSRAQLTEDLLAAIVPTIKPPSRQYLEGFGNPHMGSIHPMLA